MTTLHGFPGSKDVACSKVIGRWAVRAALLAALVAAPTVAMAKGKPVPEATPEEKTAAGKPYTDALELHKDGKFEEALTGFRASYDIVASPNSHLMIANTLADMKRNAEAYHEAGVVISEAALLGEDYVKAGTAAQELQDRLKPLVGFVTVNVGTAPADATLTVAGREIPSDKWSEPVAVEPGAVEVVLQSSSGPQSGSVEVNAGATASVDLSAKATPLEKVEPAPTKTNTDNPTNNTVRIAGFASAGVGVVGIIGFAILGAVNNNTFSDLEESCTNGVCPPDREEDISTGESLQTGANVMAAIGAIGLVAGAALITVSYTIDLSGGEKKESVSRGEGGPGTAPQIELRMGLGSVGVLGRF